MIVLWRSPHICPMFRVTMHRSEITVAVPNKAGGSLNIASEVPPSFRNRATNQNQRAGKSIPLHSVLKSDGGAPIGAYVTLSGDRADHDFVRVNVLWKVRQVPNSSEQGHAEKPGDYGYFPGWPTDRTQCTRRRIYRARAEESREEQQAHACQP